MSDPVLWERRRAQPDGESDWANAPPEESGLRYEHCTTTTRAPSLWRRRVSNLPWIRFDTSLPDHPKILELVEMRDGRAAAFVYCCSLAYAGKHGTDGFIPQWALSRINGRPADAKRLCDVRLWNVIDGGWEINGWDERQESTDESQARRVRAQKAAAARWTKERARGGRPLRGLP